MRSIFIIVTLSMVHLFLSCTKDNNMVNSDTNTNTVSAANAVSDTTQRFLLALGDSYTIGQSVPEAGRFPVQTVKYLNAQGMNFHAPEIIARTGWTTGNLLSSLADAAPLKQTYDIVTLLIGVNNQYQHGSQQQYTDEFLTLLDKAIQFAGNNKKRVIVLSIPDYSVTPFANGSNKDLIAKEIDAFNAINKKIATEAGVNYLDITGFTRMAATDASLIASDGLHPSGVEYQVWAYQLLPVIKTALK